jgi:hypothetical protein
LWALFSPTPVKAQLAGGVCIPSTITYTAPTWFPACDATGHLLVSSSGTITATLTLPYAGTNGQTLTAASFVGVGARDGNGQFSPLAQDTAQNLRVVDTRPLNSVTVGKTASATSASLAAPRALRKGLVVFNSSTSVNAYIAENQAAAIASGGYTYLLPAGGTLELTDGVYTGQYNYISDSADGSFLNVTERY